MTLALTASTRLVALLLGGDLVGFAQFRLGDFRHRLFDLALVGEVEIARLLGGAFGQPDDRLDHRLEAAVAGHDGGEHRFFGKLLGLGLDHQHGVGGAGDDEVELGSSSASSTVGLTLEFAVDEGRRGRRRSGP